jgi:hypothetical protein
VRAGVGGAARDAAGRRDPDNELYDRASDLVEAAAGLRRAMRPEAAAALPALLGCLNVAFSDLRRMSATLQEALDAGGRADGDDLRRGIANLSAALREVEAAAAAGRILLVESTARGAEGHAGS